MYRCLPIAVRPTGEQGADVENKGASAGSASDGCSRCFYAAQATFHVRDLQQAAGHSMLWDAASNMSSDNLNHTCSYICHMVLDGYSILWQIADHQTSASARCGTRLSRPDLQAKGHPPNSTRPRQSEPAVLRQGHEACPLGPLGCKGSRFRIVKPKLSTCAPYL